MNQEYQQPTFLPQKEAQHPESHRDNLKQRFGQTPVISPQPKCVNPQQRYWGLLLEPQQGGSCQ